MNSIINEIPGIASAKLRVNRYKVSLFVQMRAPYNYGLYGEVMRILSDRIRNKYRPLQRLISLAPPKIN
jgi:hypothetical protein